jgi:predicted RNA methylase
MLRMTPPLIAWAQAVALMVVGTQAMMLPPAFLPTPPTIKKRRAKMKRECSHIGNQASAKSSARELRA